MRASDHQARDSGKWPAFGTAAELDALGYWISEHVVRALMGGSVSVKEIEATLRAGRMLEEHRHPLRGTSHLACALVRGKPVHVRFARLGEDAPVLLLAYVPGPPLWASPVRRAEPYAGTEAPMRSCYFCAGELKSITVGNFDYRLEGVLYVVKKVPAMLCLQCGEKYLDAATSRRLGELIEAQCFTRTEEVKVIDFEPPSG